MVVFATSHTYQSPFDFTPQTTQDADLLRQIGFIPGLKELLMVRQVHALEHATVWVLSDPAFSSHFRQNGSLGGMSTDQGFYLYGAVQPAELQRAVHTALHRLVSGDWNLAVHPRCGTNLSVGMMLTAGLAMGISLMIPKGPVEQVLGLGIAAVAAAQLTPDAGAIVQQYITTAVPFNLAIDEITNHSDHWGRPVHFIKVHWVD